MDFASRAGCCISIGSARRVVATVARGPISFRKYLLKVAMACFEKESLS